MSELTIWTLDWVPDGPRGFVRDLRLRWACEEAGLTYSVRSIPFEGRETNHLDHQPFGQVPFMTDGDVELFESGAGLLHLARKSEKLMPRDPMAESETLQWTIAALNSIEMVTVPWWFLEVTGASNNHLTGWLESRLNQMERVLNEREWLVAGRFTVADLLMADVLRVSRVRSFGDRPATEEYVKRVTDRGSFKKAHADQIAHVGKRTSGADVRIQCKANLPDVWDRSNRPNRMRSCSGVNRKPPKFVRHSESRHSVHHTSVQCSGRAERRQNKHLPRGRTIL